MIGRKFRCWRAPVTVQRLTQGEVILEAGGERNIDRMLQIARKSTIDVLLPVFQLTESVMRYSVGFPLTTQVSLVLRRGVAVRNTHIFGGAPTARFDAMNGLEG